MADESIYVEAFLGSVLKGDATLTGAAALNGSYVYPNRAPQDKAGSPTLYPLVIYSPYDSDDVNTGNATRLFINDLYRVYVVGKVIGTELQDGGRVRAAANRLDEVLRKIEMRPFTVEGVTLNFNTWRERRLPPPREVPGATADIWFRYYGGLYRVEAHP